MKSTKSYFPYFAGIVVSIIFGFSFMFTKNSLEIMTPLQVLAYRFLIAALILSVLKAVGVIKIDLKGKRKAWLVTLAFIHPVIYFVFETTGINLTSSSEAGMMIALIPIIVTILGAVFLKEKPSFLQTVFTVLSVFGVFFIMLSQGMANVDPNFIGIAALIGAVLSAGIFNILSRKLSFHFKPVEITFVMMWVGAITFNILAVGDNVLKGDIANYYKPLLSFNSWLPILYLGVISSVIAFFMMNYMLSKMSAFQSAVFANLTTVISILAGVFIRGEAFQWYQAAGGVMILLGVWGTNYFSKARVTGDSVTV